MWRLKNFSLLTSSSQAQEEWGGSSLNPLSSFSDLLAMRASDTSPVQASLSNDVRALFESLLSRRCIFLAYLCILAWDSHLRLQGTPFLCKIFLPPHFLIIVIRIPPRAKRFPAKRKTTENQKFETKNRKACVFLMRKRRGDPKSLL